MPTFVWAFVSVRVRALPHQIPTPSRSQAVAEFKRNLSTHVLAKANIELHPWVKAFVEKSDWNTTACQQLVMMLRNEGWVATPRFIEHCTQRNMTLWADQVPEDGFNYAKAAARRVPNKRLSHASVWMAPVRSHVLDKVHKWLPPQLDMAGEKRNIQVEDSAFEPSGAGLRGRLSDIKTPTAPTWRSPGPDRLQEYWFEQALFLHVMQYRVHDQLSQVWMKVLFVGGEMLVRDRTSRVCGGWWLFP